MIKQSFFAIAVALFFTPALPLRAQEHPEHPQKTSKEHPQDAKKTKADISAGIKENIASESKKAKDGKFHANYEAKDFACVDMKAADGTIYDIDFFMSGKPGDMKVTETSVHKVNGKALYNWKEENGVWKKVAKS
jgi:hypothetical protein